jgi:predicted transcriptional regulator
MKTAEDILNDKRPNRMVTIAPDATIAEAIRRMVESKIGAILVEQAGEIVGIWTERDLLREVDQHAFNPTTARIGDHMQNQLHAAGHDTPVEQLEEMFLGLFIRHILIKKQDSFIGLLSIGDVLRASLLEKDRQIKKLNTIASWQYYENWGWDRNKSK